MIRIPLRVRGVDLDNEGTLELLGERLSDLTWSESDGTVLAILHTDAENPVAAAVEAARKILHVFPEVKVLDVDQELVSASDIAFRIGVSREAVRLWIEGHRGPGEFPSPIGVVGNGKSRVWRWNDVHFWLRHNFRIGDDETYLTPQQVAELNAALLQVKLPIDHEWELVTSFEQHVPWSGRDKKDLHGLLSGIAEQILTIQARSHMNWALLLGEDGPTPWMTKFESHHTSSYIEVPSTTEEVEELT
jgi:hypothetical protein